MPEFLQYAFMQRALVAAFCVRLAAPAVGVLLVQRRLALMGDGIGHVALAGVLLGFLLGAAPVLTAVVLASVGAVTIELVRQHGRTSGDVALALFYVGGVVLIGLAPDSSNANLLSYLFGSLTSVSPSDLVVVTGELSAGVLLVVAAFGRELFPVRPDEEHARMTGLGFAAAASTPAAAGLPERSTGDHRPCRRRLRRQPTAEGRRSLVHVILCTCHCPNALRCCSARSSASRSSSSRPARRDRSVR